MKRMGLQLTWLAMAAACATVALPGSTAPRVGSVQGSAFDSIRHRPLGGGFVELRPAGRQFAIDPQGRFRIDSVPADVPYTIAVLHPLLDTLGIIVASPEFTVGAFSRKTVDVAVPSAASVVSTLCSAQASRGPGALVGFVRELDTGATVDSAEVILTSADGTVMNTVNVPPTGRFRFCGLPGHVNGYVRVRRNRTLTEPVAVTVSPDLPLAYRGLGFPKNAKPPI